MKTLYGAGGYKFDAPFHLSQTDNEVLAAMRLAAKDESAPGSSAARAILERGHFRRVYTRNPSDEALVEGAIKAGDLVPSSEQTDLSPAYFLTEHLNREFGSDNIHYDKYFQNTNSAVFPVLMPDERIETSTQVSEVIRNIPLTKVTYIFASPAVAENATDWIAKNRVAVLKGGQK
jgi:hypothetical protein